MDANAIRAKVREIIVNITNIDPEDITEDASFFDDLQLDSLSLLEIGVDVDYEFKLGVPEEELKDLRTLRETVALVQSTLGAQAQAA